LMSGIIPLITDWHGDKRARPAPCSTNIQGPCRSRSTP
jgi:hypothetical protein